MKKNRKGFTLIELLVVIAIIGLLSTLAVVALNNARAKGRDARRLSDIKQIQTALELYFNDCNTYPASTTPGSAIAQGDGTCAGTVVYMAQVPSNPNPRTDGGCADSDYTYTFDSAQSYHLTYCIGQTNGNITGGTAHTATPAGIVDD